MYESPIKVVFSDLVSDSVKKTDEYIVACVQQVGVYIDKDELTKALKFDREQYEKGWNDRDNEIVRHGHWIRNYNGTYSCSECKSWIPNEQHYYARYCLFCGAKMDEVKDETD